MSNIDIRTVNVVQYLSPLREGGSLPGLIKGDDGYLYVCKFRGAGHGKKALISEFIGGELARTMGLKVPELVFLNLDDSFGKTEPDEEIQDLLKFSVGLNLGLHFLSSAITYDPIVTDVDPLIAAKTVLLDGMISNIDRTVRNTNLLIWNKELWLIDHGASFYFHHNWPTWKDHLKRTFPLIKDHVLLESATKLPEAASLIKSTITDENINKIVDALPEEWLEDDSTDLTPTDIRDAYRQFLCSRLSKIDDLVKEANNAR
jgi:hypothetical protein